MLCTLKGIIGKVFFKGVINKISFKIFSFNLWTITNQVFLKALFPSIFGITSKQVSLKTLFPSIFGITSISKYQTRGSKPIGTFKRPDSWL